ncbi:MAG: hypothetical protein HY703_10715 [Gemmatimonadetes bacterium]|nr:hypothetical protein [Gemmatimonadota bacterium]
MARGVCSLCARGRTRRTPPGAPAVGAALWLAAALGLASCELEEVTTADPEDVIVAEIVLRAGQPQQLAFLHGTLKAGAPATVRGARISVSDAAGRQLVFHELEDKRCTLQPDTAAGDVQGTCYATDLEQAGFGSGFVRPGERYTLRMETADGRLLTGATVVPGTFQLRHPELDPEATTEHRLAPVACTLPAGQPLSITWTAAAGAWVYIAETDLRGLRRALAPRGITVEQDPLRLFGLNITREDTSMVFPTDFGVFERLELERDLLLAIRYGLPPHTLADVVIAAADRNYVHWHRGGNFNPSGLVRIPSIRGDGTGVFASVVPHIFRIIVPDTAADSSGSEYRPCIREPSSP